MLLSDDIWTEEFSHTVLHHQNIFEKPQAEQFQSQPQDQEEESQEEQPSMSQDEINSPGYMDQDIDPIEAAQNVLKQI